MIWIGIPFFGIMILAALQSIPDEIYEAADMDGCGMFRKFFSLTLPYIKPTVIMTILLRTIWIFNSFDLVVIVTQGGPANYSQHFHHTCIQRHSQDMILVWRVRLVCF
ncbi:MAG: carbohydrate ABC transporter permease [Blautia obeum]